MIRAIVTDIEGTTSSISFVHDVLFPYARARMREFVLAHVDEPAVAAQLDAAREVIGGEADTENIIQHLLEWIDQDRKLTPLKALQGMIWQQGYADGDFYGHVYADACENLRKWHSQGFSLYVYSSGSVQAQKLLFGHTRYGDLTPLFSGYFDTAIGGKLETESYQHIVNALELAPAQVLFLSDVEAELDAADTAGLHTCGLRRDGELPTESRHIQVHDFNAIKPEKFTQSPGQHKSTGDGAG